MTDTLRGNLLRCLGVLALACSLPSGIVAQGPGSPGTGSPFAGNWEGVFEVEQGNHLDMRITVRSSDAGTLEVARTDSGAAGWIDQVRISGDSLHWTENTQRWQTFITVGLRAEGDSLVGRGVVVLPGVPGLGGPVRFGRVDPGGSR